VSNSQLVHLVELKGVGEAAFKQNRLGMEQAAEAAMLATLRAHAGGDAAAALNPSNLVAVASWRGAEEVVGSRRLSEAASGTIDRVVGGGGVGGRGERGVVTIEVTVSGLPSEVLASVEATMKTMTAEGAAGGEASAAVQSFRSSLVQQMQAEGVSAEVQSAAANAAISEPVLVQSQLLSEPRTSETMVETWVMATVISIGAIAVFAALLLYSKGFRGSKVHLNDSDEKATKVKTSQVDSSDVNAALVGEMAAMRKEIVAEMTAMRKENVAEMTAMRKEMAAEMTAMRNEMAAGRENHLPTSPPPLFLRPHLPPL
jgi:hypothetical protein